MVKEPIIDTRHLFGTLTSCKVGSLEAANLVTWQSLSREQKEALATREEFNLPEDVCSDFDTSELGEAIEFVDLTWGDKDIGDLIIYVNTEGFTYARYVLAVGMLDEDWEEFFDLKSDFLL